MEWLDYSGWRMGLQVCEGPLHQVFVRLENLVSFRGRSFEFRAKREAPPGGAREPVKPVGLCDTCCLSVEYLWRSDNGLKGEPIVKNQPHLQLGSSVGHCFASPFPDRPGSESSFTVLVHPPHLGVALH